jgi:aspartokinase/homoserine dehydrogenase 1
VKAFVDEIKRREIDDIELMTGLATIAVVGSGMVHTPGIAARIFNAVAGAEANVVAIAQGASERIISFVVDGGQVPAALKAVHSAFHLHKVGGGKVGRRAQGTDIILLGVGRVGRELVNQITASAQRRTRARAHRRPDRQGELGVRRARPEPAPASARSCCTSRRAARSASCAAASGARRARPSTRWARTR